VGRTGLLRSTNPEIDDRTMSGLRHIRTQELWLAEQQMGVSGPAGVTGWAQSLWSNVHQMPVLAHIGRYKVETETGHGDPVRVFRAFDPNIGRPVTLKVLADVSNGPLIEQFRREVLTAANVRHASMIAIYELGEHAGVPFVAMPYLGDYDLRQVIQTQKPLTLLQKMLMMWQVAEAVRAAHSSGLSYVGVRPAGIAVGGDGCLTIQDFGIVRLTGRLQNEAVSYASPEELTAEFLPDPLCDIFAFGTIYYELLTGKHPFLGASPSEARIDILHHDPTPLHKLVPECPEALAGLVSRALDKHRELRYQSLDEIQYDAESILRGWKRSQEGRSLANARRLADAQEVDDAQVLSQTVSDLDPENLKAHRIYTALRPRLVALLQEADEEATARCFGNAVEILESALRLDGVNLAPKDGLGSVDRMLPDSAFGKEPARHALPEADKQYQDELQMARVLFDRRQFQEAEQILIQSAAQNAPDVQALLETVREARAATQEEQFYRNGREKALELIQEQQFEQAADLLCNVLALFPGDPVLERDLRYAQELEQDRHEGAVLSPENPGAPEPCELQTEPSCEKSPAQLVETKSPLPGGWAVIAAAGLFLLVADRGVIVARAAASSFQESKFISEPSLLIPRYAGELASRSRIVSVGMIAEENSAWRASQ